MKQRDLDPCMLEWSTFSITLLQTTIHTCKPPALAFLTAINTFVALFIMSRPEHLAPPEVVRPSALFRSLSNARTKKPDFASHTMIGHFTLYSSMATLKRPSTLGSA